MHMHKHMHMHMHMHMRMRMHMHMHMRMHMPCTCTCTCTCTAPAMIVVVRTAHPCEIFSMPGMPSYAVYESVLPWAVTARAYRPTPAPSSVTLAVPKRLTLSLIHI